MSFLNLCSRLEKSERQCKLLIRIKIDSFDSEWFYLRPEDQFICQHNEKFRKVNFKKFKSLKVKLFYPDHLQYYNSYSSQFEFKSKPLIREQEYFDYLERNRIEVNKIRNSHHCEICTSTHVFKPIRKRAKLTVQEKIDIAFDLGQGLTHSKILNNYNLSKRSLRQFIKKKTFKNCCRKVRTNQQSSLSDYDKKRILEIIEQDPFINSVQIKNKLKVQCSRQTIFNFLKRQKIKLHWAKETPFLNETNRKLKGQFCSLVKDLTVESHWSKVVFTDEKILQSFHNSKIRVFRKRAKGFDKRYIFRKEKQIRHKLNLWGYITYEGVGKLFVFKNKAKGEDYKYNMANFILPSIRSEMGNEFILQQDNATTHNNQLVFDFFKEEGIKLMIWPPKSPMFNIIENCWSIMARRVNELIFYFGQPKSEHDLYRYALVSWKSISPEIIKTLYNSVPKRINNYITNGI